MEQINIDNIDIYEVDKNDYSAYFYRLPKNDIIKTTPREGLSVYKDIQTGAQICGILTEQIMGTDCNRYFIFNFMDENRLGAYKTTQYIQLSEEEFEEFLSLLPISKKENN